MSRTIRAVISLWCTFDGLYMLMYESYALTSLTILNRGSSNE